MSFSLRVGRQGLFDPFQALLVIQQIVLDANQNPFADQNLDHFPVLIGGDSQLLASFGPAAGADSQLFGTIGRFLFRSWL